MFNQLKISGAIIIVVSTLFSPLVSAQDDMRKALAKSQFLLRKVNQEKTELQVQLQNLQKEIEALQSLYDADIAKAKKRQAKLEKTLSDWKESHGKLRNSLGDTKEVLLEAKRKMAVLGQDLQKQTDNFALCYKNNEALVENNVELLDLYQNKGVWAAVKQNEPVTGLSKVQVENLVQDKRYHIDDLYLKLNDHLIQSVVTPEPIKQAAKAAAEELGEDMPKLPTKKAPVNEANSKASVDAGKAKDQNETVEQSPEVQRAAEDESELEDSVDQDKQESALVSPLAILDTADS